MGANDRTEPTEWEASRLRRQGEPRANLIPVCASCHRIRRGDRWVAGEGLQTLGRSLEVTHSLCPDCLRALYPDVAEAVLEELGLAGGASLGTART